MSAYQSFNAISNMFRRYQSVSDISKMLKAGVLTLPKFRFAHSATQALNPLQEESLKENCMLVDEEDKIIGSATKRDCHRVKPDGSILLHRAFSVFLFNSRQELLLQKRSDTKVTFPGCFTNTCCSHPLLDFENERIEANALGVKLAAIRRLNYELGVPKDELEPKDIKYVTRIIYKSEGDGIWGEHEIDYVLFIHKDVTIKPNPEEVSEVCYIPKTKFNDFIKNLKHPITPWFRLIVQNQLNLWWDNIKDLDDFMDHKSIYHFP